MIDIVMTAVARPEIVKETLQSLIDNMKTVHDYRLIIEVGIIKGIQGQNRDAQEEIIQWAYDLFRGKVLFKMPSIKEHTHAKALKWCLYSVTSKYSLYWEDDWVLEKGIDLDYLIGYMELQHGLGKIEFDKFEKPILTYPPYMESFFKVGDCFYSRKSNKSLCGPPALLRYKYIKDILKLKSLDGKMAIDSVSRTKESKNMMNKWEFVGFIGHDQSGSLVRDTGSKWRVDNNILKMKSTKKGIQWVQK